jgi:hypothetical protein
MDLQELIDRGEELKGEKYDSPAVDMWENDVKAAVAPFGDATAQVLHRALFFGQMIMSDEHGQQMHIEAISKAQVLLRELQKRNPDDTQAQSQLINQKKEEAKATLGSKFGSTTFNGPVTFGNNSPANNIQVSELMLAIISQAEEALPDGPEKNKILSALKSVTTNPTFASIAGAGLPEIIKRLFT